MQLITKDVFELSRAFLISEIEAWDVNSSRNAFK